MVSYLQIFTETFCGNEKLSALQKKKNQLTSFDWNETQMWKKKNVATTLHYYYYYYYWQITNGVLQFYMADR